MSVADLESTDKSFPLALKTAATTTTTTSEDAEAAAEKRRKATAARKRRRKINDFRRNHNSPRLVVGRLML